MSNLGSLVDVWKGWPNGSALASSFKQKAGLGANIVEGIIVALENEAGVPVFDTATSGLVQVVTTGAIVKPDHLWLVIQGVDQWDGTTAAKATLIKLHSGVIFKVPTALEHNTGDMVYANAGVVTSQTHAVVQIGATAVYATTDRQPVGQVIEFNSYEDWVVVAS
jgi:hypothetical protein